MRFGTLRRSLKTLGLKYNLIGIVLVLQLCATVVESLGVTMLLPLFELIVNDGTPSERAAAMPFWKVLDSTFNWIGIPLTVPVLSIIVVSAIFGRMIFVYLRQVFLGCFQYNFARDIRILAFGQYLDVSLAKSEQLPPGNVVNDIITESTRAVTSIHSFIESIGISIMISVYSVLLLSISPQLTATLAVIVILEIFAIRRFMRLAHRESHASTNANKAFTNYLSERISRIALIRLSQTESKEIETAEQLTSKQFLRYFNISRLAGYMNFAVKALILVTMSALFYTGHKFFALTLPVLMVFLGTALRNLMLIQAFAAKLQTALSNIASITSTERLLDDLSEAREELGGSELFPGIKQNIKFESVSFRYAARLDIEALNDVTLEIPAGGFTAIVGPSGAGKSTLVDLLPRLRQPTQGRITIDGRDIATFELLSLRRGIAYVPQEPQLFNVSVGDHIRYGNDSPAAGSADAVKAAATLAGAAEFIEALPQGYDTMLGEGGIELSGGQRQRLDLARAVMRGAPVLILDEPTSRLDAEAEHVVKEALQRIRALGTTVIVVAHRFTTVAAADQIHVFENGRLTASGDHESLTRQGGWYARAFRQQSFLDVTTDAVQSVNA